MQLTLSTLGTPSWTLDEIITRASEYGFDGIDFRTLENHIDVTQSPHLTDHLQETKSMIAEAGLEVSAISSGIGLCEPEQRDEYVAEAERTVPIANELGADYVRVFGRGDLAQHDRETLIGYADACLEEILDIPGARNLQWVLETHDNWISSTYVEELLETVDDPNVGVLWDIGHTTRVTDEPPAETIERLGDAIEYLHLKDASYDPDHPNAMGDGWRYVLPGEGELPLASALELLDEAGYNGWVNFEHEKRWHEDLPDPVEANQAFIRWFRGLDL